MREILFRGKRTDNGEWIYGDLRHISNWKGGYNPHIVDNTNGRNNSVTGLEIIPETVGQYTGLTDKNGVRIFEGDILKSTIKIIDCDDEGFSISHYDKEDIGIVEWEYNGFMIVHKPGTWARGFYGCENYVIGNIHDNPKLLEGGEDNG